jgi:hypothetical protein
VWRSARHRQVLAVRLERADLERAIAVREPLTMGASARAASAWPRAAGGPERFADAAEELIDPEPAAQSVSVRGSVRSVSA